MPLTVNSLWDLGIWAVILLVPYQLFFVGWVLLRPRRLQASSLAWILVILMLPILGGLAFLVFGQVWADRERVRRHREIVARVRAHVQKGWERMRPVQLPLEGRGLAALAERGGDMAVRPGNEVRLLSDTEEVIEAMARDIEAARDHCHLLFYIYLDDGSGHRIAEALLKAASQGVSCRVLVDSLGSKRFLRSELRERLEEGDVQVVEALPTRFKLGRRGRVDIRNHRKILVIDGDVGWTGSQNIADAAFAIKAKYAPWVDCMVRVEGPLVRDLQELFVEDWFMDTREPLEDYLDEVPAPRHGGVAAQLMPTGVNSQNDALVQVIQAGIQLAREEVVLTTPYFVPDEGTLSALVAAAARGVRTQLVVPRRNDSPLVAAASRSCYEPLLEAGAEIYEYTRGLLHSKTITVDRVGALLGSANLDRRSFEINFELSVMFFDDDFSSQVRALQRSYMDDSILVDPAEFMSRPMLRRIWENACGLVSPLL
jgi:cardiolipin synthase